MALYAVLPTHIEAAGIAAGSLGIILSVHRFVRLLFNALAGLTYDRFGGRQPFLLGMAFALTATLTYTLAPGFWLLAAGRVVWGAAYALITVGAFTMLMDVSPPAHRGRTIGGYQSVVQIGTLLVLLTSGILTDIVGYRSMLAIFTGATALGLVVAFVGVTETRGGRPSLLSVFRVGSALRSDRRQPVVAGSGSDAFSLKPVAKLLLADRRLLAGLYVNFSVFFAGNGVLMATLGFFLRQEHVLAGDRVGFFGVASLTGALLAFRRLVIMLVAPVAGRASDRAGDRWTVAALGLVASVVGFVILAMGRGAAMFVLALALVALGEGVTNPSLTAWLGDASPPHVRGTLMAAFATAADLGGAAGPLVGYLLAAAVGLRWAYAMCAVLFITAFLVLRIHRVRPRTSTAGDG